MQKVAAFAAATLATVQAQYGQSYHGYSPTNRHYSSVEYKGKNGRDYGFGETIGEHKSGPDGYAESNVSSSWSTNTYSGSATPHNSSLAGVHHANYDKAVNGSANILGDILGGS